MGPGSWFSSVIPHLLVPQQREALEASSARKIVILNLDAHPQTPGEEFAGSTPEEHLELFHRYAPDLRIDYFLVDPSVVRNRTSLESLALQYGESSLLAIFVRLPAVSIMMKKIGIPIEPHFQPKPDWIAPWQ